MNLTPYQREFLRVRLIQMFHIPIERVRDVTPETLGAIGEVVGFPVDLNDVLQAREHGIKPEMARLDKIMSPIKTDTGVR